MKADEKLTGTIIELDADEAAFAVGGVNAMPASKRCGNPACRMYGKTRAYPRNALICKYCGQPSLTEKYIGYDEPGKTE